MSKPNPLILPAILPAVKEGLFILLAAWFLVITPSAIKAQTSDGELWKGISLEREFFDKLKFEVADQVKLRNNFSTFKSNFVNLEAQYKIIKMFRVASGYRFTLSPTVNSNRFYIDLIYKMDFEKTNLELSVRTRTQHEFEKAKAAENVFRPKVTLSYSKKKLDIEPFIASEAFYVYSVFENEWQAYRLYVGLNYKLAKKNTVKLAYFYQKEFNEPDPASRHVIQLVFSIDLTEKKKKKKEEKE